MIRQATLIVLLPLGLGSAAAAERLPPEKLSADIAQRYGVGILRVIPTESDGRAAYAVVVMNPDGNDNGAFQVNTLIVDAETGAVVPQFVHRSSGYTLPLAPDRVPRPDDSGPIIRSLTDREYRQR